MLVLHILAMLKKRFGGNRRVKSRGRERERERDDWMEDSKKDKGPGGKRKNKRGYNLAWLLKF